MIRTRVDWWCFNPVVSRFNREIPRSRVYPETTKSSHYPVLKFVTGWELLFCRK
ncbi:MAG: hypothetical protein [Olavius algarvensis Gamma 1 endosymbiont]|nr:MAG: hypothetical protein [Olavius algarvensis Gamma 1 endosymbiont]